MTCPAGITTGAGASATILLRCFFHTDDSDSSVGKLEFTETLGWAVHQIWAEKKNLHSMSAALDAIVQADYNQVVVQSIVLVSIPVAAMILGGLYPLAISEEAPNKKLSFALQHFAGIFSAVLVTLKK
jgi:hypothetical protein